MTSCDTSSVDELGNNFPEGTPVFKRRSYGSSCGSSLVSPETEEFESLEKTFKEELEQKLHERKISETEPRKGSCDLAVTNRRLSELQQCKMPSEDDPMSLQLVEKRQLRSFSRADEYLYAMKEDLAEWLHMMYPVINIDAENFMDCLQTGEHLLRHANAVRRKHEEILDLIARGEYRRKPPSFSVPETDLPIRENVTPGTWFARDNVYNFIKFCRLLQVMEVVMFETEDLVSQKNEKHVILTLLEVARKGAKIGMLAPMLVQFEQEIDQELAREEKERKKREREEKEREKQAREEEKARKIKEREEERIRKEKEAAKLIADSEAALQKFQDDLDMFPSLAVEVPDAAIMDDVEDKYNDFEDDFEEFDEEEEEIEEEEEEEEEGYPYPIGPMPQEVTNDLRSLDEMVRDMVEECQCPTQFPMIRVSEGKYRIGETQVHIFVRILRSHVMVRVGGGWDTLQNYLDKHDPCRCRRGHRSTVGARMNVQNSKSPMASGVTYDRHQLIFGVRKTSEPVMCRYMMEPIPWTESPATRRRSSGFQPQTSRQGSFVGGYARQQQWDSPRGSLTCNTIPRSRSPSAPHTMSPRGSISRASGNVSKLSTPSPLTRDNSESHIPASSSKIRSQKMSKEDLLLPSRSDSSCSLGKMSAVSTELSSTDLYSESRASSGDTCTVSSDCGTLCDTSSEVSDEGYKSSQGNVSQKPEAGVTVPAETADTVTEDRPESSMTVGSDCSSTISSEDESSNNTTSSSHVEDHDASSQTVIAASPAKRPSLKQLQQQQQNDAGDNLIDVDDDKKSQDLSPSTKNRLANLFNRIPKFGKTAVHKDDGAGQVSESKVSNSAKTTTQSSHNSAMRTLPPSGTLGRRSGSGINNMSTNSRVSPMTRTRSASSENGFARNTSERGSYRAPRSNSRYLQAAEAYANKNKSVSSNASSSNNNNKTWSSSSVSRARSRPGLTSEHFTPPASTRSRTASASPGLHRKRMGSVGSSNRQNLSLQEPAVVTSTHSTPSRKPNPRHSRQNSKDALNMDCDTDEQILKRMEEILFTYKSKVEDKLAAEGKALPKDIFDDFTEHWVASSPHRAKSVDSLDSSEKSSDQGSVRTPKTPNQRKEHRDGQRTTRIPAPTFYKSQSKGCM